MLLLICWGLLCASPAHRTLRIAITQPNATRNVIRALLDFFFMRPQARQKTVTRG